MKILGSLLLLSVTFSLGATEILTGFRVETIARGEGFVSSIVADSKGTIYFTTTNGWIHRVEGSTATKLTKLPTQSGGNGGLLGMALIDDQTAAVHYTTWKDGGDDEYALVLDDVISRVDLVTGEETVLQTFVCDVEFRERGVSSEHHGGNPTIGPDGSIFVGIGDYGGRTISQKPGWNGGRIWRIDADGEATEWALGLRNPYDLAWDPELGRIVLADNGPTAGDEIHVIEKGDNLGWPDTFGFEPPVEGMVPPDYVFPMTVAPTGLARLDGTNFMLRRGYLLGGFVTRALYYFPRVRPGAVDPPIPILDFFPEFVIDVTQAATGEIYFATSTFPNIVSIHRLHPPARGDCNGDGVVDVHDLTALALELAMDGNAQPMLQAHEGRHTGSWGCDANADGLISTADHDAILSMITPRRRSVRSR
jgi:glucose/arabinose dehydrogenase